MRRSSSIALLGLVLLAACGGGSKLTQQTGGAVTSGSGSGGTVLEFGYQPPTGTFESANIYTQSGSTKISAGGSTSLQVNVYDKTTGALYTGATTVTFTSSCNSAITIEGAAAGTATTSTTTGTVSATYVAGSSCVTSDTVDATAVGNGQTLTASVVIPIAPATVGSIEFISATPSNITLEGTGATTSTGTSSATSAVVFEVLDTAGSPSNLAAVTFSLNTTVGGITLTSPQTGITGTTATGTTSANGQVEVIVGGGSVATTVRVTAATNATDGGSISTQSSALTISTGIPTSNNISLSVKCPNVEAWNIDGVTVPVTVRMTDRFSNPVPDGTTANFRTTLGGIQGTCQTASSVSESGVCTVNWVSKAPYSISGNPQTTAGSANVNNNLHWCVGSGTASKAYCNSTTRGRSPLSVTAVGEESFVDANGNGIFDTGDTTAFNPTDADNDFTAPSANAGTPKPWQDTSEPFLNEWEIYDAYGTPTYISGEPFIDFNNNGSRDGPDGYFNGSLCTGPLCSGGAPASANILNSVAISAANIIIVSGQHANFAAVKPTGAQPFSVGTGVTIGVYIFDDNYQQMPSGTTVVVSFSTGAGTLASPAPAAWPCSSAPPVFDANGNLVSAGQYYGFAVAPATPETGGSMFITVTTPDGLITTGTVSLAP